MESSILFPEEEKDIFLRRISELVEDYRVVAIKSQLFASFYIRRCLSANIPLQPIIFNQAFFYACIQKVLGKNITNTNQRLPRADINTVFEEYDRQFFDSRVTMEPGRTVHANALASLANISAQTFVLHVSENYTKILKKYIKIRLREVFVSIM